MIPGSGLLKHVDVRLDSDCTYQFVRRDWLMAIEDGARNALNNGPSLGFPVHVSEFLDSIQRMCIIFQRILIFVRCFLLAWRNCIYNDCYLSEFSTTKSGRFQDTNVTLTHLVASGGKLNPPLIAACAGICISNALRKAGAHVLGMIFEQFRPDLFSLLFLKCTFVQYVACDLDQS